MSQTESDYFNRNSVKYIITLNYSKRKESEYISIQRPTLALINAGILFS